MSGWEFHEEPFLIAEAKVLAQAPKGEKSDSRKTVPDTTTGTYGCAMICGSVKTDSEPDHGKLLLPSVFI
jgi:hypothetical protein